MAFAKNSIRRVCAKQACYVKPLPDVSAVQVRIGSEIANVNCYWHGRHQGGGDRNHRPGKSEGERPVNRGDVEQPKAEQPKLKQR